MSTALKANRLVCGLLASTFMLPATQPAHAQPDNFNFKANCLTDGTSFKGEGRDCTSPEQCFDSPKGYAINKDSVWAGLSGQNGRNNSCNFRFANEVPLIPGKSFTAPTTICISAHAMSPGGMSNAGARGWSDCEFTGAYEAIR